MLPQCAVGVAPLPYLVVNSQDGLRQRSAMKIVAVE